MVSGVHCQFTLNRFNSDTAHAVIHERSDMVKSCKACGGTGDKWDEQEDDWADPLEECPECDGTGEDLGDEYPVAE